MRPVEMSDEMRYKFSREWAIDKFRSISDFWADDYERIFKAAKKDAKRIFGGDIIKAYELADERFRKIFPMEYEVYKALFEIERKNNRNLMWGFSC